MKKLFKIGFVAIFAAMVLGFVGCSEDSNDSDSPSESHSHTFATDWSNDDTHHWKACDCGEQTENAEHTWGDWETVTAATTSSTGTKKHSCTVCKKEVTEEIPRIKVDHTHEYSGEWQKNETQHWKVCDCGAEDEKSDHTWSEETTEATCTTAGSKTSTCTVRNFTKTETIPAKGHTFSTDTWEITETHHWRLATCEHKDEKFLYEEHRTSAWTITKPATLYEEGEKKDNMYIL